MDEHQKRTNKQIIKSIYLCLEIAIGDFDEIINKSNHPIGVCLRVFMEFDEKLIFNRISVENFDVLQMYRMCLHQALPSF
ncbi:hypothetical protein B9Z51_00350 [Limnohabitans sp. T6-5]|uniref:hypothetical protein n=1 Tax=Limnohabitans sp. T6-5 TaxID=1100724 RepID=UPI000D3D0392|nr:hypothetical protein [Limnohabitans sp. T6-5]PUE10842.1 hypothetical protein B9Z51_00350 [Limnohabitans sp. T6-5]